MDKRTKDILARIEEQERDAEDRMDEALWMLIKHRVETGEIKAEDADKEFARLSEIVIEAARRILGDA